MTGLFDRDIARTATPAGYAESAFSFYNRSSWASAAAIRLLLESWFAAYPRSARADLRRRFRSGDDGQHLAAWWELYLHALFSACGFELDVHPELDGTTRHPDFRIVAPNGTSILLEAVTTRSGIVMEDERHEARESELMDALNEVKSDVFGVVPHVVRTGPQQLRLSRVRREVQDWLNGLDPSDERWDDQSTVGETFVIQRDGWHVVLEARRHGDWRDPDIREGDRLLIGSTPVVGAVNDAERFRSAVDGKRKRYGDVGEPYVIAVLSDGFGLKDRDVMEALLGSMAVSYIEGGARDEWRWVRMNNGLWCNARGPVGQNISGLLVASSRTLHSWRIARTLPVYWPNPWASHPLPDLGIPCARRIIRPGNLNEAARIEATRAANEVFGLPSNWPGEDS